MKIRNVEPQIQNPRSERTAEPGLPSFGFRHSDFFRSRLAGSFGFRISQRAHSLIEFIGVLAVLVILAAAITPVVVRRMDRAAWTKEVNDLGAISNALSLSILRNYTVPNESSWAATAANWTARPVSQISTNNRRYARLFLYDSGGWMTNASAGSGYTQTTNGTATLPANARISIVSTIGNALP